MLTDEHLHAIMPALPKAKRDTFLPFLNQALDEFSIDSAPRHAAFLAQLAHESGQFRFMEEIWGPTPAQQRYEPTTKLATSLGNTKAGDGKRFKGRGPIRITGRANYRRFGNLLHVDLVSNPALGRPSRSRVPNSRSVLDEERPERTGRSGECRSVQANHAAHQRWISTASQDRGAFLRRSCLQDAGRHDCGHRRCRFPRPQRAVRSR